MGTPALGLGACALSSVLFGSVFVPVKRLDAGNGVFVQWVMAAAIFLVGLAVSASAGFPQFQPWAMLGGAFWAIGNVTAVPIMNVLGMGMGMLIWGITNCVTGWAVGRFGLFGVKATIPSMVYLNYFGLLLVITGGFLFSQITPTPKSSRESAALLVDDEDNEDLPLLGNAQGENRQRKRIAGVVTALLAGTFYGVTFVPVIYIQDHPDLYPYASKAGLDYVFSHFTGIFATATALLLGYILYTKNDPFVNPKIIGPGLLAGTMWGIAQSSWFVANDNLSQSVTFPIISMVPGVCAALWSVFYFRDIEGRQNFRILTLAVFITLTGATLVGISK